MARLRQRRVYWIAGFDLAAWTFAFVALAAVQRVVGLLHGVTPQHAVIAGLACGTGYLLLGTVVRLHQGRAAVGSFEEAVLVTLVACVVAALSNALNLLTGRWVNGSVALLAPFTALALMVLGRGLYRLAREQDRRALELTAAQTPVVVVGAGAAARQLITSMLFDASSQWRPVALVDDDPLKRYRRIRGVPVLGRTADLAEVAEREGAETVVVAIPSAQAQTIRHISAIARDAGLDVKVLPGTNDLLVPSKVGISDLRDINVTDLLGRHQIETDVASIASYLTGKRVLVTGAGGSIGSELCRQIAKFGPEELIMLDRDESALHAVQLSIYGRAMLDGDDTVLVNIRDTRAIDELFELRQPQVVFHAAALKHLPLLEKAPSEALKTNVWGSLTILEAAARNGVERFVNVSTDKAANPCSVLGYSKRLAEGLTAAVAREAEGTFLSVRFGNVLGSRGSVLTAFASQIAHGGPVTVTDPKVNRYFMTVQEAVQLVIQAGAIGNDGEALVLDMGEPVSIDAVARQLIDLSGERIEVVYTGLRPGEKMQEDLLGDGEPDDRPVHPLISHAHVPPFSPLTAREMDAWTNRRAIIEEMQAHCGQMAQEVVGA